MKPQLHHDLPRIAAFWIVLQQKLHNLVPALMRSGCCTRPPAGMTNVGLLAPRNNKCRQRRHIGTKGINRSVQNRYERDKRSRSGTGGRCSERSATFRAQSGRKAPVPENRTKRRIPAPCPRTTPPKQKTNQAENKSGKAVSSSLGCSVVLRASAPLRLCGKAVKRLSSCSSRSCSVVLCASVAIGYKNKMQPLHHRDAETQRTTPPPREPQTTF